jgi:GntR family transcriptional regulator
MLFMTIGMPAPSSGIPRYHQIARILRSRLEAADGQPIVTEMALCREFGVSRTTVRRALDSLKREGLLSSRTGVGTRSTRKPFTKRAVRSSGDPLHGMLQSKPYIASIELAPASSTVATFFEIPPGERVCRITRVHELDGTPLSVVRSHLPVHLGVGVPRAAWRQPMHELLLKRFGVQLKRSVHTIRIARATSNVAALLRIGLADPVLSIEAAAYDVAGEPIRWTENFFREDLYEYVAEMEWPAARRVSSAAHGPARKTRRS